MDNLITKTESAYSYPLLVKNLFRTPIVDNPEQEIVYRGEKRFTYRQFRERVGRLAAALTGLGVKPGDTVAVMDWDSHRYLECFYAVPMIGAVLHTVNVRLPAEQLVYTIGHAEDAVILVNVEFVPLLEQIKSRIETVRKLVLLTDAAGAPTSSLRFAGEYEELLAASPPLAEFSDLDENTRATTFYTTGTTGLPKGVYFSHRQLVLHTLASLASLASSATQGRFHREDVYMPLTPMFHVHAWGIPYVATTMGVKQIYPGRYVPEVLLKLLVQEKVTFSHCVPTILNMLVSNPATASSTRTGTKCPVTTGRAARFWCARRGCPRATSRTEATQRSSGKAGGSTPRTWLAGTSADPSGSRTGPRTSSRWGASGCLPWR